MYETFKTSYMRDDKGYLISEKSHDITVITTGGTIDKSYDESDGSLKNRESLIADSIGNHLRLPYTNIEFISVMSKDSLDMTDRDRDVIVDTLLQQIPLENPLVVIHGTDTMAESADYCSRHIKAPAIPIIFTGAMSPLGLANSDAMQNIAEALLAAKLLPGGIYICFHNQIFPVPGTRKNRDKGTFEMIDWNQVKSIKDRDRKSALAPQYL
ncbi:MAG: asparaginase domain-containing protein [Halobacteriovoraceae bacterium]|nr:asparaginase domain-containing protein [Halobacteriovoraceae bacterium]